MLAKKKGKLKLEEAARVIGEGGVIVFPTDTVFGVGCRFDDKAAVERLYEIKNKPKDEPLPILIGERYDLEKLSCQISREAQLLMDRFWPGGLTVILPCSSPKIPSVLFGKNGGVGFRLPNHPQIFALIQKAHVPLIGTSANFHGERPPKTFEEINPKFFKLVDGAIYGECFLGEESTVVDCTGENPIIIREGAIKLDLS